MSLVCRALVSLISRGSVCGEKSFLLFADALIDHFLNLGFRFFWIFGHKLSHFLGSEFPLIELRDISLRGARHEKKQ